jgi:NADPH:quinone reductase-like Zn-dependent oxidoreductase
VTTVPDFFDLASSLTSPLSSQKCKWVLTNSNTRDLIFLKKFLEKEKIKPIIDRVYTLDQIREAHLFAEAGHVRGKIVISIPD